MREAESQETLYNPFVVWTRSPLPVPQRIWESARTSSVTAPHHQKVSPRGALSKGKVYWLKIDVANRGTFSTFHSSISIVSTHGLGDQ
jgi:hypothetical protein